jgi:hypothetical protein
VACGNSEALGVTSNHPSCECGKHGRAGGIGKTALFLQAEWLARERQDDTRCGVLKGTRQFANFSTEPAGQLASCVAIGVSDLFPCSGRKRSPELRYVVHTHRGVMMATNADNRALRAAWFQAGKESTLAA